MKIAVLSSHTPSLFWFRMDMMKAFQMAGYEVYAVANEAESEWRKRFLEYGITYRQIKVSRNGTNPINDLKALRSIKKVLGEIMPDKVFTYQAKTIIYGGLAAKQLGIKEIYSLVAGMGSLFLKNDLKTKIIRNVLMTEYRIGMSKNKAVFFQNRDDELTFRTYKIIRNQDVVMLPGSGVNLEKFNVQPQPESTSFLCISRLIRDKGVHEYLEASRIVKKAHPDARFLLVGPFDTNPSAITPNELQDYIDDGTIEYYGEQEDVRPYFAESSVFVLPSYREGTPKTNLEAMACGKAVITTDAPGCRETVENGVNGYLVPVKDVAAVANRMLHFIEHPGLAEEMGKQGRIKAEKLFDVNIVNSIICKTMGIAVLVKQKID